MNGPPVPRRAMMIKDSKCEFTGMMCICMCIITYSRTRRWRKFQEEKIYNSEEQVPIEFVRVTCFNNAHFEELFFNMCGSQDCKKKEIQQEHAM